MHTKEFLMVTAFVEVVAGLFLLILPAIPIALLLGLTRAAPETLLVGRVAGAALLCIGIASWLARHDHRTAAQRGLLVGILFYNAMVSVLLAFAGIGLGMAGGALWPAVVLHTALAAYCAAACLWGRMADAGIK